MRYDAVTGSVVALGLLAAPLAASAQQPAGKPPRIGVLCPRVCNVPPVDEFREGLREFGHVEGQNVLMEYRFAEGRDDRFAGLAAELATLKVDVIVTWSIKAIQAAQGATKAIPVVMGRVAIRCARAWWPALGGRAGTSRE